MCVCVKPNGMKWKTNGKYKTEKKKKTQRRKQFVFVFYKFLAHKWTRDELFNPLHDGGGDQFAIVVFGLLFIITFETTASLKTIYFITTRWRRRSRRNARFIIHIYLFGFIRFTFQSFFFFVLRVISFCVVVVIGYHRPPDPIFILCPLLCSRSFHVFGRKLFLKKRWWELLVSRRVVADLEIKKYVQNSIYLSIDYYV